MYREPDANVIAAAVRQPRFAAPLKGPSMVSLVMVAIVLTMHGNIAGAVEPGTSTTRNAPDTSPPTPGRLPADAQPVRNAAEVPGDDSRASGRGQKQGEDLIRRNGDGGRAAASRSSSDAGEPRGGVIDMGRLATAVGIVLGLLVIVLWVMRRVFPASAIARSTPAIRVVSRSVLAPRQQVLLLHVGRRLIVVGDTGSNMSALSEITDPDEVAAILGKATPVSPEPELGEASAGFLGFFRRASEFPPAGGTAVEASGEDVVKRDEERLADGTGDSVPPASSEVCDVDPRTREAAGEVARLLERARALAAQVRQPRSSRELSAEG